MHRQGQRVRNVPEAVAAADRLHSAAIHLLRRLRVRDQEAGIGPSQLSALSVLVFAGPRSLKDLAAAEQVRPPTMSRIVTALIREKMVRSTVEGDDKRRLRLEATEKGVAAMQAARRRRIASLARALRRLPKERVRQLAEAAELIDGLSREI